MDKRDDSPQPTWVALLVDDRVTNAAVLACFAAIFLSGFSHWTPPVRLSLQVAEQSLALYFVFEILVKIRLRSWAGFWQSRFNRIDLLLVAVSTIGVVLAWLRPGEWNLLILARAARLFTSFRILKVVPNSAHIVAGLKRALRASVGVVVFLAIYNAIHAVISCALFAETAPEHFGNPAMAFYSIFKIMTIEGWYEIPDYIAQKETVLMGSLARVYFGFVVVTGGILGLSLANAIFVDEMTTDNNDDIEEKVDEIRAGMVRLERMLGELKQDPGERPLQAEESAYLRK